MPTKQNKEQKNLLIDRQKFREKNKRKSIKVVLSSSQQRFVE